MSDCKAEDFGTNGIWRYQNLTCCWFLREYILLYSCPSQKYELRHILKGFTSCCDVFIFVLRSFVRLTTDIY